MESAREQPEGGPGAHGDVVTRIYVSREVTDIEIDLTVPRHIHVNGTTRAGKTVERLINITRKGGISLV